MEIEKTDISVVPTNWEKQSAQIKVIGVGGGGTNAVSYMFGKTGEERIEKVDFVICNTDMQSLQDSPVAKKIQLGKTTTNGLGAGCDPQKAKEATLESENEIRQLLNDGTIMVFITAGMGGGTGTGASPEIARIAKELGILTVAVVTLPFRDEDEEFTKRALEGIHELQKYADSLLIIDNQKLYSLYGDLVIWEAFEHVNEILRTAVKGISDIITKTGYVNADFNDVKRVMQNSGMAIMGIGMAEGENRAVDAVNKALYTPLLNDVDLKKVKNILVNISCSRTHGATFGEIKKIMDTIRSKAINIGEAKRGVYQDDSLGDKLSITLIATGLSLHALPQMPKEDETKGREVVTLNLEDEDLPKLAESVPTESESVFEEADNISFADSSVDYGKVEINVETTPCGDSAAGQRAFSPKNMVGCKVAEYESQPAYKRRMSANIDKGYSVQNNMEDYTPMQLTQDENGQGLSSDNSYIHQSQD